jgi:hypothetical protein
MYLKVKWYESAVFSDKFAYAARGTEDARDLTEDLRIYPRAVDAVSGRPRGSFHAGFLNRAQLFPLQVVFNILFTIFL